MQAEPLASSSVSEDSPLSIVVHLDALWRRSCWPCGFQQMTRCCGVTGGSPKCPFGNEKWSQLTHVRCIWYEYTRINLTVKSLTASRMEECDANRFGFHLSPGRRLSYCTRLWLPGEWIWGKDRPNCNAKCLKYGLRNYAWHVYTSFNQLYYR